MDREILFRGKVKKNKFLVEEKQNDNTGTTKRVD